MDIKAVGFWSGQGTAGLVEEKLPFPKADQVLVETLYSGVSRGTELMVFQSQVPQSEHERMRAPFQQGSFDGKVKYGYSNVGKVTMGPKEWMGQRVFCLFPHQDRYVVSIDQVHRIPDALPSQRAVLAANMETAVNAIADAGLDTNVNGGQLHTVTVIGAGVVGSLVAHQAMAHGHEVELIDIHPQREKLAAKLGIPFAVPDQAQTDRSVVVHASATEAGLVQALDLAKLEGLIVEVSWFGTKKPALPLGEAFHAKRLTIRSSQVGHISPARRDSWTHASRLQYAFNALTDPRLEALITHKSDFHALPAAFDAMAQGAPDVLCHLVEYGNADRSIQAP